MIIEIALTVTALVEWVFILILVGIERAVP